MIDDAQGTLRRAALGTIAFVLLVPGSVVVLRPPPSPRPPFRLSDTPHRVIRDQHDDGTDHGDHEAVEIEPGHAGVAEERKDPTPDDRANDAEH
jgi:hypothetical protein